MADHPGDHPGPLVFVTDLDHPALSDADAHHLVRVLRLRPGDPLTVADGAGRFRPAALTDGPAVAPTGEVRAMARREPTVTVGFALVKGEKPELVVQKLTELGVDRIVPFRADRSVVRWDDAKAAKALERLRAVAASAAAQCHRADLPVIDPVTSLDALLARDDLGPLAMADRGGEPPSLDRPTVLVGPEGGWSDRELALPTARVALGGHVLRAETAAVTAGALLTALRGGVVTERR